jgi:5'-methylthioadenosine phosphorylase
MVGMTLVPEAFLAKELEMCYGAICYITNYAEGIKKMPYKKGVLFEGTLPEKERELVQKSLTLIPSIIKEAVIKLASAPRSCPCKDAMLRYKKKSLFKF